MSATNGSTTRSRGRLLGVSLALVFALTALFAANASAKVPVTSTYAALGDSLAFGYSQELFNQNFPTESPTAFEHGYANYYLNHLKPALNGVQSEHPVAYLALSYDWAL